MNPRVMKADPISQGFAIILGLLICERKSFASQAGTFKEHAITEKRYYEHEVHLDDNKHNDEFFSFVTVWGISRLIIFEIY